MKLIRGAFAACRVSTPCVASIGTFDGLHLGHRFLLEELKKLSTNTGLPSMVISFEPRPQAFFLKEKAPKRLLSFRDKFSTLEKLGLDIFCVLRFDKALASLSPEDFVAQVLLERLQVRQLIVGEDFRFGQGRRGDIAFLKQAGAEQGFSVQVLPPYCVEGEKVSSTRIRTALNAGKVDEAARLLSLN